MIPLVSVLTAIIFGFVIFIFLINKKTIILNYNFDLEKDDKVRINNKCFHSF